MLPLQPLPKATENQPFIKLTSLSSGTIHLPLWMFVQGAPKEEVQPCPSMSWLLHHSKSGKNIIFDLGLPKDISCFPPAIQSRISSTFKVEVEEDVFDGLKKAGLDPEKDVEAVIFSHLHWDHTGDPKGFGSTCEFIIGPAASTLLTGPRSYPSNPEGHFDSNLFGRAQMKELPDAEDAQFWKPLGPFPETHDYFADGSLFIVNAPGHLTGHLNLLVRLEHSQWMYLAGDSCHDVRILYGEEEISVYDEGHGGGMQCAHVNKEVAEQHLGRMRKLGDMGVELVLAHDWKWDKENRKRFS
jgi:glyoxylase-like metal-dependent hydrolase (beta-lactamase superfamily II)